LAKVKRGTSNVTVDREALAHLMIDHSRIINELYDAGLTKQRL
jgi:hypothetical protein